MTSKLGIKLLTFWPAFTPFRSLKTSTAAPCSSQSWTRRRRRRRATSWRSRYRAWMLQQRCSMSPACPPCGFHAIWTIYTSVLSMCLWRHLPWLIIAFKKPSLPAYIARRSKALNCMTRARGAGYAAQEYLFLLSGLTRSSCGLNVLFVSDARYCALFPTCQVRIVRFYQSCSSSPPPPSPPPPSSPPRSPPPPLPPLPCSLPPCQLFAKLWPNFRTQSPLLDLNCKGLSALGTAGPQPGTWDPPSSVSTAGPQPGTLRAQWAPLDLNRGPSELSEHRWTSTAR